MIESALRTWPAAAGAEQKLTRLRLDSLPLPPVRDDDDKERRGVVLAIGGSVQVLGAVMLTGVAALRAGAGKLQLATVRTGAPALGHAVPEAMVLGLPTSRHGEIDPAVSSKLLRKNLSAARAVVIGPGMMDSSNTIGLVRRLMDRIKPETTLVLDGAAVLALGADEALLQEFGGNAVMTPHAGEMASLLEIPIEEVRPNAAAIAQYCADRFQCVVVLKGGDTWIAEAQQPMLHYVDGKSGLGTSGSGDVLAGVITGLAARGAAARTAAAWGVWAHGSAGNKLSRSIGKVGFLASELLVEIPRLVAD